jgi:hypothetical protein
MAAEKAARMASGDKKGDGDIRTLCFTFGMGDFMLE